MKLTQNSVVVFAVILMTCGLFSNNLFNRLVIWLLMKMKLRPAWTVVEVSYILIFQAEY